MANTFKYENQIWGEPIAGERLSTNGHYTGEHKGTPTQDALGDGTTNSNPHYVEDVTIRYGTITQDAVEGSTPEVATAE
jgi:hypothetical protein